MLESYTGKPCPAPPAGQLFTSFQCDKFEFVPDYNALT